MNECSLQRKRLGLQVDEWTPLTTGCGMKVKEERERKRKTEKRMLASELSVFHFKRPLQDDVCVSTLDDRHYRVVHHIIMSHLSVRP